MLPEATTQASAAPLPVQGSADSKSQEPQGLSPKRPGLADSALGREGTAMHVSPPDGGTVLPGPVSPEVTQSQPVIVTAGGEPAIAETKWKLVVSPEEDVGACPAKQEPPSAELKRKASTPPGNDEDVRPATRARSSGLAWPLQTGSISCEEAPAELVKRKAGNSPEGADGASKHIKLGSSASESVLSPGGESVLAYSSLESGEVQTLPSKVEAMPPPPLPLSEPAPLPGGTLPLPEAPPLPDELPHQLEEPCSQVATDDILEDVRPLPR